MAHYAYKNKKIISPMVVIIHFKSQTKIFKVINCQLTLSLDKSLIQLIPSCLIIFLKH